jgi:hypothetical protein
MGQWNPNKNDNEICFGLPQNGFRSAGRRQHSGFPLRYLEAPSPILTEGFQLPRRRSGFWAVICSNVYGVVTGPV